MEKKKILVVDDERDISRLIKARVESAGYSVITAFDGAEALKAVKEQKPDLVLLDVMLPKIDGYQVCRLIKFDEKYRSIPVIMLTARAGDSDKEKAMEAGADGYLTKPFQPEELFLLVGSLLK